MTEKFKRRESVIEMYKMGRAIYEMVGYKPRGSSRHVQKYRIGLGKKRYLARLFFYKYGMDNGISYSNLTSFTGDKNHCNAYRLRRTLNKLLITSPEIHELYNRFKIYKATSF